MVTVFERFQILAFGGLGLGATGAFRRGRQRDGVEKLVESSMLLLEFRSLRFRQHFVAVQPQGKGIDEYAVLPHAEMKVRSGRASRRSDVADELARLDRLTLHEARRKSRQVGIAGGD